MTPRSSHDRDQQALPRRAGARQRRLRSRSRRDPRASWRERRRQIDASQDSLRRRSSRTAARSTLPASKCRSTSPHAAQKLGIVTIYQEFTLAPNMTIAENVFIGREPGSKLFVNWRRMAAETRAITKRIGLDVNPMASRPRSLRRRAADGGDRPRAFHEVAPDRHGRADLGAQPRRGRKALSHRPRPEGGRAQRRSS